MEEAIYKLSASKLQRIIDVLVQLPYKDVYPALDVIREAENELNAEQQAKANEAVIPEIVGENPGEFAKPVN